MKEENIDKSDEVTREDKRIQNIMKKNNIGYSDLEAILKSSSKVLTNNQKSIDIGNKKFYYAYFSDAHMGSDAFQERHFDKMVKLINQYKPDFVLNAGDTLEGMSNRNGHVYELTHIGFHNQFNYAKDLLSNIKIPIYGIDGNHDQWYYIKSDIGLIVGKELEKSLPNYNHLGEMEGDLKVNNVKIKLFHGNDGSAYATSYKLQKLIESLDGGDKPDIVHSGHYHKSLYTFIRNVHGIESGTLCTQSKFMRGKKIPAHTGFGFVRIHHNNEGQIKRFNHEFIPFYK